MSCKFYNNGCGNCLHFVKTNSVLLNGETLELNIPNKIYHNKEKVCICIAQSIPQEIESSTDVTITIGEDTTQYPMLTKCGNFIKADQLRSRRVYHTHVATDSNIFMVSGNELCHTSFNFPIMPIPEYLKGEEYDE